MIMWFVWSNSPWFERGADHNHGLEAGVFAYANDNGNAWPNESFRVVLLITMIKYDLKNKMIKIYVIEFQFLSIWINTLIIISS